MQVTSMPSISSTSRPVGSRLPQVEPSVLANSSVTAAAVPGTPAIRDHFLVLLLLVTGMPSADDAALIPAGSLPTPDLLSHDTAGDLFELAHREPSGRRFVDSLPPAAPDQH
jgi:hypothetical protein